jgi:hypothetical protein
MPTPCRKAEPNQAKLGSIFTLGLISTEYKMRDSVILRVIKNIPIIKAYNARRFPKILHKVYLGTLFPNLPPKSKLSDKILPLYLHILKGYLSIISIIQAIRILCHIVTYSGRRALVSELKTVYNYWYNRKTNKA